MPDPEIRFDDGAAYESFMGAWSRLAGERFLDALAPAAGLRWVDVGCGNGAFTALLATRAAAAAVHGVDPSEGQLAYARAERAAPGVRFEQGDAMALPLADGAVDAAVMALVLFFVPEPARGVAEMARVVRPGGLVAAYTWDMHGGGFPFAPLQEEMAALGVPPLWPPSADASRAETMRALWTDAGLADVHTWPIAVERTFPDVETFWQVAQAGPRIAPMMGGLSAADRALLKARLRARLAPDADGRLRCTARANAIRGRRPG